MPESRSDIQEAKQALRRFIRNAERKKWERRISLLQIVKKSVSEFLGRFKTVHRLSLAGSFAKKPFYSARSDLDIVVKGLKKEDYFKAFLFWEKKLPVPIDLIREEEVGENLKFLLKHRVDVFTLDPERVALVAEKWKAHKEEALQEIRAFLKKVGCKP